MNFILNRDSLIKLSVLVLLIVQTSLGILLMRYSRLYNNYSSSVAVFCSEIIKTFLLLLLYLRQNQLSFRRTWEAIQKEIIYNPKETIKLFIPGFLYSIQNNIVFVALSNLDAATFQITYQLKILTTCLLSMFILGTKISKTKWASLIILMIGVILVQLSHHNLHTTNTSYNSTGITKEPFQHHSNQKSWILGLSCVLIACISSPFAGVYYEKLIKTGAQCSVVIRNLQMGIFSLIFGFMGILIQEGINIFFSGNIFKNFDWIVCLIVIVQGTGGIIVAAVVKYTDNIQKGFATSISIVVSCVTSYFLLNDLVIENKFVVGAILVLCSTILYSSTGKPNSNPETSTNTKKKLPTEC